MLENVDTKEEITYGKRMARYRSRFLQKQIANEEREKNFLGKHGVVKGWWMRPKFRLEAPAKASTNPFAGKEERKGRRRSNSARTDPGGSEYILTITPPTSVQPSSPQPMPGQWPRPSRKINRAPQTLLEYAWHSALTCDPLVASDEEMFTEYTRQDYRKSNSEFHWNDI
ncbi:hypothetical protein M422DRAFT_72374 [Sphaerobolus stellatus SS14]|uniref:Uncharacterized protein n=1 Tax=Sphaerobolus stellatus (strain SS14) TaxID=990650 RepID=A0A0C9U5K6_SPHS4|nr:hypothetical protein M422DRAFT_72374 [Sphaerobolus stellatus SS14]